MFWRLEREIASVGPEIHGTIFGVPVANSFLLSVAITVVLALIAYFIVRKFQERPDTAQNFIEYIYEVMLDLTSQITGSEERSKKIFPVIGALFVYIGIANLIGLIPGVTSFTYKGGALFRTPTSDFNTTVGLALAMVLLIQLISIKEWGVLGYLGRFFKFKEVYQGFKQGVGAGMMAIVEFLVGLLDIVAECAKVISLSFRLFGNMFAGEVLAVLLLSAVAFVVPALWLSLNLLFAVVQAVVFGSLVAAYYSLAVKEDVETT